MKSPERYSGFQNPFTEDSGLGEAREQSIDLKRLHKRVGLIDFDNPPEGIVFIGDPLPQATTDLLMRSLSAPSYPATRRRK